MADWTKPEGKRVLTQRNLKDGALDPVMQYEDGWYFYDETWAEMYGPFLTEHEVRVSFEKYTTHLNG